MLSPKFSKFDITEVTYKTFNNQPIKAFILIPKGLKIGKHPVLVEIHGGFFVTGDALYAEWFSQWLLDYALLHSAIIISLNYRLLPESNGLDLISDIDDFWTWLRADLQTHLESGIEADLERLIVHGNSAGGTLAILSGFSQPKGFIKAVIAAYPSMHLVRKNVKPMWGTPTLPKEILENHLKAMEPGKIVTSGFPPDRVQIGLSINQQGRKLEMLGSDERLYPLKVLEKIEETLFAVVFHGEDDSIVDFESSVLFEEKMKRRFGERSVNLVFRPGEHGFDSESRLDEEWLSGSLKRVTELWLGEDDG